MITGKVGIHQLVDELPEGFDALRSEATHEGHRHMNTLAEDWASGEMRFDRPGERLLAGYINGALAGVGGLSIERSMPGAFRMRRFYVRPAFRRCGVARAIAAALLGSLPLETPVTVNAGSAEASAFWETLGFSRIGAAGHTHLRRPPGPD